MKLMRMTAAAGALLVLTSCALTTEAITQKPYAPSDGIRVQLDNDVVFENLMIVSDAESRAAIPVISACHIDYVDAFPGGADCD